MNEHTSHSPAGTLPILDVVVDSLATGGDGVGRDASGRAVFIPRTAPGDKVRVQVIKARKRWARAEAVQLLEPGPDRRDPPCPVYDRCGGCALQHLKIEAQREAKREIVRETLRRIGGLEADLPDLAHAGSEFEYRNRVTFTLRRDGERVRFGYRARRDPGEVLDVTDCPLAEAPVRRALEQLRGSWGPGASRLPEGSELKVTVRSAADGAVALHIRGGVPGRDGSPDAVAEAITDLVSYVHTDARGDRRVLAGSGLFPDRWQGTKFQLGPEVFLQVNRSVSELIDRQLDEFAGQRRGVLISDLYAGVGARALRWSREGARVIAVEADPDAIASGRTAAEAEGLEVRFIEARVEAASEAYSDADVIVVNPPRAGLSRAVVERLAAVDRARGLAYVSCDPATLARDLSLLSPGWNPSAVRAFDAFPQTAHVETLVWLEPGERPRAMPLPTGASQA